MKKIQFVIMLVLSSLVGMNTSLAQEITEMVIKKPEDPIVLRLTDEA